MADLTAPLLSGPFATWLEASRYELNQRIAAAGRASSSFRPDVLAAVLRELVAPVVDAVEARGEGFTTLVSSTMFDIALELCVEGRLVGPVRDGWARLLPAVVPQLVTDPHRVVASITNALANLDRAPGARPAQWVDLLLVVAPRCASADDLLVAGQVASWRCGMAQHRHDALERAATLDADLAAALLPAPLADLERSPWAAAPGVVEAPTPARPVRVGGFRGFGGPFGRPPVVGFDGEHVVASDGKDRFLVFADAFGTAVLRAPSQTAIVPAATGAVLPGVASIPEVTSWADTPAGLVATSALTHAVLFLGPPA